MALFAGRVPHLWNLCPLEAGFIPRPARTAACAVHIRVALTFHSTRIYLLSFPPLLVNFALFIDAHR